MERRRIPHLAVVSLALALMLTIGLIRRNSSHVPIPEVGFSPTLPPAAEAPPKEGSLPPSPKPPGSQDPEYADPKEVVDPAKVLRGELLVRVLTTDGKPIAGAKVVPNLRTNAWNGEEGILSDHLMGGGGWTWIGGKNAIFRGEMRTNAEGVSLLQIFLPRQDKYLNGYLGISVEAPLTVRRKDNGQLRLPKEGERKEITFRLAPGQIVRGKILNLEADDGERMWIEFLLPGEEKKEHKTWLDLPKCNPDGTFESEPAPLAPLLLQVEHRRKKYLPYDQRLEPPVQGVQQIVLQRNPSYQPIGKAVFKVLNPPAGGKFEHQFRVYSETRKGPLGGSGNDHELNGHQMDLGPGAYQAFLVSLDQDQPLFARASFILAGTETTEVPLTLEPTCKVRFRVREKATGNPPSKDLYLHSDIMIGDVPLEFIGKQMGYGKTKTGTPGEYLFTTVPAGTVLLRMGDDTFGPYKKATQILTLSSAQETTVEFLLEPKPKQED